MVMVSVHILVKSGLVYVKPRPKYIHT